jgi:WS/DGAT/MGAT family acyltransferase
VSELVAGLDAGFLLTETSTTFWHIVGVVVLDPASAPEPFSVDTVRRLVAARLDSIEAFRKIVRPGPFGLLPRWAEARVDIDAHVLPAHLESPSGVSELAGLAARLSEQPLSRRMPLWEVHVVESVGDGLAAVVAKVHHALADGITAVGILAGLLDLEPLRPGPAPTSLTPPDTRRPPSLRERPVLAAKAGPAAISAAVHTARHAIQSRGRLALAFGGPKTSGPGRLTARRDAAFASMPTDDVRKVRAAFDVTFHDVVLGAVSGALRSWFAAADRVPERPLVAIIPTSTRNPDAVARSRNQVSALFVSLPVQIGGAVDRLRAVHEDTTLSKQLYDDMGEETLGSLAAIAPWRTLMALWRAGLWVGAAGALPPVANLMVTSVPGPPVPLYLAGARVVGLYPLGPILEGIPINVTAVSREDRVEVGILTCPDLVPAARAFAEHIPAALDELRAAASNS